MGVNDVREARSGGRPSGGRPGEAIFDPFAASYESVASGSVYNALYDRPTVLHLLGDVRGKRIMDAGCGPGLYAEELLRRGARVTACDASGEMVRLARARLGDAVAVRQHDLQHPLEWLDDSSFDFVLMALVIHHLEDRMTALREAHRVLVPEGRLVLSTHHPTADWLRLGGSYFDSEMVQEVWKESWHVAFWRQPLTDTCDEFRRAGFVIEQLLEPRPSDEIRRHDPAEYEKLAQRPGFIAFRLAKAPPAGRDDPRQLRSRH